MFHHPKKFEEEMQWWILEKKYVLPTMAMLGVPISISFVNRTISWLKGTSCLPRDTSLAGSSTSTTSGRELLSATSATSATWATESCIDVERVARNDCGFLFNAGSKEEEPIRLGSKSKIWKFENKVGDEGNHFLEIFSGRRVCFY